MYDQYATVLARLEAIEARLSALETALQSAAQPPPPATALDPSSPEDLWAWLRAHRSATTLQCVCLLLQADELYNAPEISLRQLQDLSDELTREQLRSGLSALLSDGLLQAASSSGPYTLSQELYALFNLDDQLLQQQAVSSLKRRADKLSLPFTPSL